MAGKYAPLEEYLRNLPASRKKVTLSFAQIEGILNSKLPSSAYEDERWWRHETEGNHVSPRAWANAGWRIETVNNREKWVTLTRL